jgi:rhodanese-related sulfurtransferase
MHNIKSLVSVIFMLFSITTFAQQYQLLSPKDFEAKMKSQKGMLIDVRTPGEFKKGYIAGAQLMNIFNDDFEAKLDKLDKNQVYYVYCAVGGRSNECTDMMKKKGFKNIIELEGGFNRWAKEKMPIVQ